MAAEDSAVGGRSGSDDAVSIGGREVAAAAGVAVVLAVVTTWPLALRLGSVVPHDTGDPLLQAWQVAWIGHALLHQPFHLFQANTFWPLPDSLAFSDAPIGYAIAGLAAQSGPHAAIVAYDLLFLFAYALAFFGAYLLARAIGIPTGGALLAGAAFAYAPWRMAQDGHLHVISSGGIPLALGLLVLGYRGRRSVLVVGGWLVAAWQMTLGFTLGLQLATLLVVVAALALVLHPWGRRRPSRSVVLATVAGLAVFATVTTLQARPYLRVAHDHPEARRTLADVFDHSPPLDGFLSTSPANVIWGDVIRAYSDETALFPGLVVLTLAAVGVVTHVLPRTLRIALVAGVATCAALSLGLRHTSVGYVGLYRILYELPGWQGIRAPGRLNTLTSLGLALLAGAGAGSTVRIVRARARTSRTHVVGVTVAAALIAAVVVEGRGPLTLVPVPPVPAGQDGVAAPVLHLPSSYPPDQLYTFWTTSDGFSPIANGYAGFDPLELTRLRHVAQMFPDARSVKALRDAGIKTVVLHRDLAAGTPWAGAAERPVAGLKLTRTDAGEVVVYRLTG